MAEDNQENKFINKINSGFPDYLDFEKLRSEGIEHLGNLSGKIWTDHNAHDPGITILEMLCYALMDLGYRTNLPPVDIFSKKPAEKSRDNNFFTAAEILTCNPTTITDFRKMLIDIEGVKNAWLEDSFFDCNDPKNKSIDRKETDCSLCYNGLYHVYIEPDQEYELNNKAEKKKYDELNETIRSVLMAHRNLCEDFIDIHILCKKQIGLCADIELEAGFEAEKVYVAIVEKLRDFFSPSPKFYTLKQLLEEKNKPIEDIFAGRPNDINKSHGFIDTDEFEQIKLKKEIHLSDVYHVIFDVDGVRAVNNLGWKNCDDPNAKVDRKWVFPIPENHIPDFSPECSVFKFARNGITVPVDNKKFAALFKIDFRHDGKFLYQSPSPYLDVEFPKGVYHSDLGAFYSIQNEFPNVYGIGEGSLQENESNERISKALQLKAYLLFFDQLLANYLAQLKNIRSLFAFSNSENKDEQHTYFLNQLTTVPDFQKLLHFKTDDGSNQDLVDQGRILAVPIRKKALQHLIKGTGIKKSDVQKEINTPVFQGANERDIAVGNLLEDLLNGNYKPLVRSIESNYWFFYMFTSSDEIALVSNRFYENEKEAWLDATSLKYAGTFKENYKSFSTQEATYSFNLELNLSVYSKYLQFLIEDRTLYNQRRNYFLDHLLSRFAERFTDFAILSFGFYKPDKLAEKEIINKEKFLSNYDELSSNRGKAFNYKVGNLNKSNVSGFQKRVAASLGIENMGNRNLCNFEVYEYEGRFIIKLKIAGFELFNVDEKFYSRTDAEKSAEDLFKALRKKENLVAIWDNAEQVYKIKVVYSGNKTALFTSDFAEGGEAQLVCDRLQRLFSNGPFREDTYISENVFKIVIKNHAQNQVCISKKGYEHYEKAVADIIDSKIKIGQSNQWDFADSQHQPFESIYLDERDTRHLSFFNLEAFRIDINDTIVGRPGKFNYEILDREQHNFKFRSVNEFDTDREAADDCCKLLVLLTNTQNYFTHWEKTDEKYSLLIMNENRVIAEGTTYFDSKPQAIKASQEISNFVKTTQYFIHIELRPHRWKFEFFLGYREHEQFTFRSVKDFESTDITLAEANEFYRILNEIVVSNSGNKIFLVRETGGVKVKFCEYIAGENVQPGDKEQKISDLLALKKKIISITEGRAPGSFSDFVKPLEESKVGKFVYRLLDKDNPVAFYNARKITSEEEAKKIRNQDLDKASQLEYTELFLGGDNFRERRDNKTNRIWYYYQLKCQYEHYKNGKEFILFESVNGYGSREDAQKAFDENYLLILKRAMMPENYGENKFINLAEIFNEPGDSRNKQKAVVFVPAETKELISKYNDLRLIQELIKISKSYPIRVITEDDDDFYTRFPCAEKKQQVSRDIDFCNSKLPGSAKYYYFVLADRDANEIFQSVRYFGTQADAMIQFRFLLVLIPYRGNYIVERDDCDCQWKIYIKEVLAESKEGFENEKTAWEEEGIEKFICVSQTPDACHTYLDKKSGRFRFNVSCNNTGLVHPGNYDSAKKRDETIFRLLTGARGSANWQLPSICRQPNESMILNDFEGKLIAMIEKDYFAFTGSDDCDECIIDFIKYIINGDYIEEDAIFYLKDGENKVASFKGDAYTLKEWRKKLLQIACYYPIIKNGEGRFEIEIKFPHFNTCADDFPQIETSECGEQTRNENPDCFVAWKTECCFESCLAAIEYYKKAVTHLINIENYLPVFECDCGPFGIRLICDCSDVQTKTDQSGQVKTGSDKTSSGALSKCCNEIIAFNPQSYTTPKMVCEAAERTKKLINCEGLHLVEHILLRPRCPRDCDEKCIIELCPDGQKAIHCEFEWKESGLDDPCSDRKNQKIYFIPGADPYSFIATLVLPSWPERFRKSKNRLLIENLLYREAPAHILLRIMWLAPYDFCHFESHFKKWNLWLSQKNKECLRDNPSCKFIEFLSKTKFKCLDDPCLECLPCEPETVIIKDCFEPEKNECEQVTVLKKINELFCWEQRECDEKKEQNSQTLQLATGPAEVSAKPGKPIGSQTNAVKKSAGEPSPQKYLLTEHNVRFFNNRRAAYIRNSQSIIHGSAANEVKKNVKIFFDKQNPSGNDFKEAIALISGYVSPEEVKNKKLNKTQANSIISNIICYLLDKICIGQDTIDDFDEFEKYFAEQKKMLKTKTLLENWKFDDIMKEGVEIDAEKIKILMPEIKN
jgi:hypothetical protein